MLIVFLVVLQTGQFHVVLALYISKTKFACMHILQAKFSGQKNDKNTERRAGLRFDRIHEKLNYPKRFTDNIEKKIKDDLFFIKTIGLGPWQFHCFTEFFTGTWVQSTTYKTPSHHISCRINSPFENLFSSLVLLVRSTVFLCLTQRS